MTKLSFIFLLAISSILVFRLLTFSPIPIADDCELKEVWNLNRVDNFSGLIDGIDVYDEKPLVKFLVKNFYPLLLSNSQILVSIECNVSERNIIWNSFRNWYGEELDLNSLPKSFLVQRLNGSVDIEQKIYKDGGELIREINVLEKNTGKIKFYYRKKE